MRSREGNRSYGSHRTYSCRGTAPLLLDNLREDIALAQDLDLTPVDGHIVARVAPEDDLVALLHRQGRTLAVVAEPAGADRQDAAALRLLLRRVRQQDAARRL